MKHSILFSDGVMVSSGASGAAIGSVALTRSLGTDQELNPGGVSAAVLDLTLFPGDRTVSAGEILKLYNDSGALLGTFIAQEPRRSGGLLHITAYDFLSRLDTDAGDFLKSLTFPLTLSQFAAALAAHWGLTLTGDLPDYRILAFSGSGLTGRQLLSWAAQACGCFCTADPEGSLSLRWLRDTGLNFAETGDHFFYQGTLTLSDYDCAPIDRVQIALTDRDAGVSYPESGENPLSIRGNYLLTGDNEALARQLLSRLGGFSYAPCTFETATPLAPGDVFTILGRRSVAMEVRYSAGRYRVTATGAPSRTGTGAISGRDLKALNGRMLELQWGLNGVHSELSQLENGKAQLSAISQQLSSISAQVSQLTTHADRTREELARMQLGSDGLELQVTAVERDLLDADRRLSELTQRFRFDAQGLTISDSASGMAIRVSQQEIAFTGTTVITPDAMDTTNLQVRRGLTLGSFLLIPRSNGNLSFRWIGGNT